MEKTPIIAVLVWKKCLSCYFHIIPNVKINIGGKNHQMLFICVVTASYTLGFLMTKSPGLVFRMKHKISNKYFLVFSLMEKNAYQTVS